MVFARKASRPKILTRKIGPLRPARGLLLTAIAYIAVGIGVIALWTGSRRNIDRSYFAIAQAATVEEPPPVEVFGTPGIADMHAVVEFKRLARNRTRSEIARRSGAVRPRPKSA